MRHRAFLCIAIAVYSQLLWASPKSDSIVAFTGSQTKIVWMRWAWCNQDYTPKGAAAADAAGASVMLFDTDEGQERVLGTGHLTKNQGASQGQVRISRSGRWVTVAEKKCSFIFDLTGAIPNRRVFLDSTMCNYWTVKAWGRDSATGAEFAYALSSYSGGGGAAMYKIPVNADGSANVAGAVQIVVNGSPKIDGSFSVSADMKKIGGLFPWADNPAILDVATGTTLPRKNGPSCHTNLAADNSYRFFHLNDDHNGIYMWDKNLSGVNWYVSFEKNMLNNLTGEFWSPRWTNDLGFVASTYPAYPISDQWESGEYWGYSAATVKAKPLGTVQFCVLQKFTPDFHGIEKSIAIASDIRNFEYLPDVWIAGGYTGPSVSARSARERPARDAEMRMVRSGTIVSIGHAATNATIRVMDAHGRVVRQSSAGVASVDIEGLRPGTYVVTAEAGDGIGRMTMVR